MPVLSLVFVLLLLFAAKRASFSALVLASSMGVGDLPAGGSRPVRGRADFLLADGTVSASRAFGGGIPGRLFL